jgi:hypothetical protein
MIEIQLKTALSAAGFGDDSTIRSHSINILRKINNSFQKGFFKKLDDCRHILAVEASCRLNGIPFEKENLYKLLSFSRNEYMHALRTVKNVLRLNWKDVSIIDILSARLDSKSQESAYDFLEKFQKVYVSKLDTQIQQNININTAEYHAVAFFLAAKSRKVS